MITLQFWQAISIFVVAVLLGGAMGWLLALRQGGSKAQHDARALEREFDQYRDEVSSHFVQTSELVGRLSESYRDVFDHLASGAQRLCNGEAVERIVIQNRIQKEWLTEWLSLSDELPLTLSRDYASKRHPDEKGLLTNDYDLDQP